LHRGGHSADAMGTEPEDGARDNDDGSSQAQGPHSPGSNHNESSRKDEADGDQALKDDGDGDDGDDDGAAGAGVQGKKKTTKMMESPVGSPALTMRRRLSDSMAVPPLHSESPVGSPALTMRRRLSDSMAVPPLHSESPVGSPALTMRQKLPDSVVVPPLPAAGEEVYAPGVLTGDEDTTSSASSDGGEAAPSTAAPAPAPAPASDEVIAVAVASNGTGGGNSVSDGDSVDESEGSSGRGGGGGGGREDNDAKAGGDAAELRSQMTSKFQPPKMVSIQSPKTHHLENLSPRILMVQSHFPAKPPNLGHKSPTSRRYSRPHPIQVVSTGDKKRRPQSNPES
jgi:hypothetical protein